MVLVPSEISGGGKIDVRGLSFNPIVLPEPINVAGPRCGVFRWDFPPVSVGARYLGRPVRFERGH
ncbi:hypothetical protein GCM10011517_12030 [Actibacterium pelagium]|uniref:Uncharacterized protein n=1 Tax=Actibacterium pelagium TaxID=2029103 RepID=A0A917AEX9_9RHOB|nr:hypothetical protein GCM10011517_12030 [Actibacterium pelagium]